MRIYVSGPMTGKPALNFPAFNAAAAELRALGIDVVNPAELNPDPGKSWRECMAVDIKALVDCDAILLLDGWQLSRGAALEHHIAVCLGMRVFVAGVDEVRAALVIEKARAA